MSGWEPGDPVYYEFRIGQSVLVAGQHHLGAATIRGWDGFRYAYLVKWPQGWKGWFPKSMLWPARPVGEQREP